MLAASKLPAAQMLQASLKGGPFISGTTFMSLTLGQRPIPMLPPPSKKRKMDDGEEAGEAKRTRSTGDAGLHPGLKSGGKRGASSGGPVSLRTLVEKGFLQAGRDNLSVNYKGTTFTASLEKDGSITFERETFNSASAFSVHAKRKLTPHKQGDDGWKSVYYAGKQLDEYRKQYNEQYNSQSLTPNPNQLPPRPPSSQQLARPSSNHHLASDSPASQQQSLSSQKQPATSQLAPQPIQRAQRNVIRSSIFSSDSEDEEEDESEDEDDDEAFLQLSRPAAGRASPAAGAPQQTPTPAAAKQQPSRARPANVYKPTASGSKAKQAGTPAAQTASSSKPPSGKRTPASRATPTTASKAKTPASGKQQKATAAQILGLSPGAAGQKPQEIIVSEEMLAAAAANNIQLETDQWVQCSRCEEWRSVPNSAWPEIEANDDDWYCENATWDVTKFQPFSKACKKAARKPPRGR